MNFEASSEIEPFSYTCEFDHIVHLGVDFIFCQVNKTDLLRGFIEANI